MSLERIREVSSHREKKIDPVVVKASKKLQKVMKRSLEKDAFLTIFSGPSSNQIKVRNMETRPSNHLGTESNGRRERRREREGRETFTTSDYGPPCTLCQAGGGYAEITN